ALLDYLEKLVRDIMDRFPPGKLPPIDKMTQKPKEEVEAALKEPLTEGWRNIYTIGNLW
ncbi:MAG TPA: creatininase family protein, partial [Thermotoga sp.]|nr:creatininase family protein [Thermotoga sp.]